MPKFEVCFDGDKCKGCELCRAFCPKGLIVMSSRINNKGYSPAAIERQDECVGCKSCALVCPDGAIEIYAAPAGGTNLPDATATLPAGAETSKHGENPKEDAANA